MERGMREGGDGERDEGGRDGERDEGGRGWREGWREG